MRNKILFISSWYPSRIDSTNGNFVQRHAEASAIYNDVEVLHAVGDFNLNRKFEVTDSTINGIRTVIIYYKNSNNPVKNFINRMKAYRYGFDKIHRPDLVHANVLHNNLFFAVYLKRKYKIPFVVSEHWTAFRRVNHHTTTLAKKRVARFIGNHAAIIMPVSSELGRGLRALGIEAEIEVLPNVVDTAYFKPKIAQKKIIFLHISNLIDRKNPEKLIEAAEILWKKFDFNIEIGGDGSAEKLNALRQKLQESSHPERGEIFGILTTEQVAARMQNASCFILYSDDENLPCVLLESISCGTPVISTDVGGVSEIVKPEYGILIQNNFDELVDAMNKVLMGDAAFASSAAMHDYVKQNFSNEAVGKHLDGIYKSVLK